VSSFETVLEGLIIIREQVSHNLTEQQAAEIERLKTEKPQAIKRNLQEEFTSKPDYYISKLRDYRRELFDNEGIHYSRPVLCAQYIIDEIAMRLIKETALGFFYQNQMDHFIYTYDVGSGMLHTAGRIWIAERNLGGGLEKEHDKAIEEMEDRASKEKLEVVKQMLLEEDQEVEKLLRKDPTGILLLEKSVEDIRLGKSISVTPSQIREFVAYGGEITVVGHKILYGFSENLS